MSPKIRQSLYYLGTIVPALLGLGLIWGAVDQGTANNVADIVVGIVSLFGAAAPATAAVKVGQQRKDGTFDPVSPADAVVNGVQTVIAQQAAAAAELEKVKNAVTSAVGIIPGIGPLAQQVINAIPNLPHF